MQITEFKGKKWAIGLDWETLPNEAAIKQEAKEVAEKTNCNFGILIDYDTQCAIGLAQKAPKEPSAALYLALANQFIRDNDNANDQFPDWILVEDVDDDKYWMSVIRNGLPSPQYDTVYDLTTIKEKVLDLTVNNTFKFFSPCGEIATLFDGIQYVENKGLNDLTADVKTKKKFEKLRGIPNSIVYAGIGVMILIFLLFALSSFIEGRNMKEKVAAIKRQQEQQERMAQQQYENDMKNYDIAIENSKKELIQNVLLGLSGTPNSILNAWYAKVGSHETGTHGWDLKKVECYFNPVSTPIAPVTNPLACDFQYTRNGLTTNRMLLQDYPEAKISGNDAVVTEPIEIGSSNLVTPSESILKDLPTARNLGFDMVSQLQLLKLVSIDYETKNSVDVTIKAPSKPVTPKAKKEGKLPLPGELIPTGIAKGELVIKNNNFELMQELSDNVEFKYVGVKKAVFTPRSLGEINWEVIMDYYIKSEAGGFVGASSATLNNSTVPPPPPPRGAAK